MISGYRAPETNAARARESRRVSRASLHMSGMAADVRLPGRDSFGLARLAARDADRRRRPLSARRLRASRLRPGAALVAEGGSRPHDPRPARRLLPLLLLLGCAHGRRPRRRRSPRRQEPPALTLAPRADWRPIPIDKRGGIATAYAASEAAHWTDGAAPGLDRAEPGASRSACRRPAAGRAASPSWRITAAPSSPGTRSRATGTARRTPRGLEFEERPRQPEERGVQPGTLVAVFLEAACRL